METLSYSYSCLILFTEPSTQYKQWKLALNSPLITKSGKALFLALMMILGLISSQIMLSPSQAQNTSQTDTQNNNTVLKLGDQGQEVQKLQIRLRALKFYQDQISGNFGEKTREAVIAFQKANGLTADGVVGATTQGKIEEKIRELNEQSSNPQPSTNNNTSPSGSLKQNDRGEAVKKLQEQLKTLKFFTGDATGYFGSVTREAVIAFQKANGLTPDGVVGSGTQTAIEKALQGVSPTATNTSNNNTTAQNVLQRGMRGDQVRVLQEQLTKIKVYSGPITGFFGEMTETAVRNFQSQNRLTANGIVDQATQTVINEKLKQPSTNTNNNSQNNSTNTVLKKGDRGELVKLLQEQLTTVGIYKGPITAYFGDLTEQALKEFQTKNGITPADGIARDRTYQLLVDQVNNKKTPVSNINQSGLTSEQISELQKQLQFLNYYPGKIDGVMGPGTRAAIQKFQVDEGLTVTGTFDTATRNALNKSYAPISTTKAIGGPIEDDLSSDVSVRQIQLIQIRLQQAGLYDGKIDGIMGKETQQALDKARAAYNL